MVICFYLGCVFLTVRLQFRSLLCILIYTVFFEDGVEILFRFFGLHGFCRLLPEEEGGKQNDRVIELRF